MTRKRGTSRRMDIHLLSSVRDDGSPFGVKYSTRRLTLGPSGTASCDDEDDPWWGGIRQGITSRGEPRETVVAPEDGARFLDHVWDYLRYEYLGPETPLVYDNRGAWRPDNFRISWKSSKRLYGGHGYVFTCDRRKSRAVDTRGDMVPVAMLEGWGFFHDVGGVQGITEDGKPEPRVVTVKLLPLRSAAWKETVLGASAGLGETKAFVRSFLRRFFERCAVGIYPETEGRAGPFAWEGGF